jgi:hypothetical protein
VGAFEVSGLCDTVRDKPEHHDRVKDECIIAYKVYDSCRKQKCLTGKELGPASDGERKITPPSDAASVIMNDLRIEEIRVVDKKPSLFKPGYWEVTVDYTFVYELNFRDKNGRPIHHDCRGCNVYSMTVLLFGAQGADLVIGTDLPMQNNLQAAENLRAADDAAGLNMVINSNRTFTAAPNVWAEAKALGLDARLNRARDEVVVDITIGLFCIIKLVRLVHLNVQSRGFCIPEKCEEHCDIPPCEYFAGLDFPIDLFTPSEKR